MILKENFFNYPAYSESDMKWGVVITALGHTHILPDSNYPPLLHPKSHQFSILKSRRVTEYQIIYITAGEGYFESENNIKYDIKAGSVFFLFPGVLHRYYPNQKTGWTEYYVGINGPYIDDMVKKGFLSVNRPVFEIGVHEKLVQLYRDIFQIVKKGMAGYQQSASGIVWHLLGEILSLEKNKTVDSSTEQLIKSVKICIIEKISEKMDWDKVSRQHGISYSKLRKEFKAYVGMSPGQYHLQLRINQAKLMLSQTIEPIKLIATSLGFQNEYYFNTIFKKKTGTAPGTYRNSSRGNLTL
ncbi:AraC family transcriptional regulator [Fulvivirgaceae bacterium BMA10]|uniref:AraC family transcriptional regulator n=1 Tax=Splendidivirga corallicola TaxID=3051826 RepID=A0ABT8KP06_9BACT|nr:AraC family transcriptional regulator [Fulvivirgaceae bacterium BMA10]